MVRSRSLLSLLAVSAPFALLTACSGGGSGAGSAVNTSPVGALSELASEVPIVGQFLADCTEDGFAIIQDFVANSPLPEPPADVPVIGDVLVLGEPDALPVLGGLEPPALPGGDLVPISIDDALSMIPTDGLPADLPVTGIVPVTCGDLPLPAGELPDPTEALALIPIFDDNGDPVGALLAVVGDPAGGAPSITDVGLPEPDSLLPEPLGGVVSTILSLLPV